MDKAYIAGIWTKSEWEISTDSKDYQYQVKKSIITNAVKEIFGENAKLGALSGTPICGGIYEDKTNTDYYAVDLYCGGVGEYVDVFRETDYKLDGDKAYVTIAAGSIYSKDPSDEKTSVLENDYWNSSTKKNITSDYDKLTDNGFTKSTDFSIDSKATDLFTKYVVTFNNENGNFVYNSIAKQ